MGIWGSRGWRPRARTSLRGDLPFWWLERSKSSLDLSVQPSPSLSPRNVRDAYRPQMPGAPGGWGHQTRWLLPIMILPH